MANVSSPGSWVDDMSAVLNKVPQLSSGAAGAIDESAAEPPAANGSATASADAGHATVTPQQPEAPATPSSEPTFAAPASVRDAAEATPAQQAATPAAASAEPAAEPAQGLADQPGATAAAAAPQAEGGATLADTQVPEAQAAADAPVGTDALGAGFSTPVKAQQPAATGSQETPAVVRSMTGVAEGFQDPTASAAKTKQSVGDVVAASLAETAPVPADEQEYDTFHEAVDAELQHAKEANSAAQAAQSPGAADNILAELSGSHPATPDPAALAAASDDVSEGAARDGASAEHQDSEPAQPAPAPAPEPAPAAAAAAAAPAADVSAAAGPAASAPAPDSNVEDAPPAGVQPATPSAEAAPSGDSTQPPAAEPANEDVEAPQPPSDEPQPPSTGSVAPPPAMPPAAAPPVADTPEQQPGSLATDSSAEQTAVPATESAPPADGTVEQESPTTPQPLQTQSSISARIAALKTTPPAADGPPTTPDVQAGLPDSDTTPNSVKARIAAMRRTSETPQGETSPPPNIPRPSPSASAVRHWDISTPKPSSVSRASGEVVTETVKPKAELKSFWEKHQPADATPTRTPLRSNIDTSNIGRKWQVKLNVPLASGKVSDLSYYRQPKAADVTPPPPPPDFKHKIGDATFPLDELKGMNADHGIDPANKELYLSDDDFLTAFAMDKDSFKGKPKWRQVLLKRKIGVF